jgi:hypothetical protein
VQITISNVSGNNCVASGVFFGAAPVATPPATASFVQSDTTTQGTWTGVYGSEGYDIFNGNVSLPSYAQVSVAGQQNYVWAASTSDPRALQTAPSSSSRIAACDYANGSFTINVSLSGTATHAVGLYLLGWDISRTETVQIADANSGTVLDTRTVNNFVNGQWLVWNLSGNVQITISNVSGNNCVASGVFFG